MKKLTLFLLLLMLTVFAWAGDEGGMKHKALLKTLVEEFWNKGNLDAADDIFAADFVRNMPKSWKPNKVEGVAAMKEYVKGVRDQYETFQVTLHESIAEGNTLALRWYLKGKHAESGKEITFGGLSLIHLNDDGKIAQEWIVWDTHDVMEQLGMHMMMGEEHDEHSTEKH